MNVLVFGGTRFMGRHLVKSLMKNHHNITVATRGITPDSFGADVDRITVDRLKPQDIQSAFKGMYFDVVFDSIAYCSQDIKNLLENVQCGHYVQISTMSVYNLKNDIIETDFNPYEKELVWCERSAADYGEVKRLAECAIVQGYNRIPSAMARFPYVIGADDYTKRLFYYVDGAVNQIPMNIDNINAQMAFVRSDEAGKFLTFLGENRITGAFNAASEGTVSPAEIFAYIKEKTGKEPILSLDGSDAPYNGTCSYSLKVDKAKSKGFSFTPLREWIFSLIDTLIDEASRKA